MADRVVKNILVPTDFSDCSNDAVEYAVSLARTFNAKVILVHVLESSIYALDISLIPPGDPLGLRQKLEEMTANRVENLKKKGIEAEGYCITGVPYIEIIKAAKKYETELIVMGTHGRTGLAHILLGSTAERVIQRAHCPVLTLKSSRARLSSEAEKKAALEKLAPSAKTEIPEGELTYCHLCAQPSNDIICEACKTRVQAEAFEMRQRVEKEGRVDTGRR